MDASIRRQQVYDDNLNSIYKDRRRSSIHKNTFLGVYGPSKHSTILKLENWVTKDILFNNKK